MSYIYDVILNFTDNFYYDFYEWIEKDNLINFNKIPVIYVNKKVLYDFINYKIKIDKSLLLKIENQSIVSRKFKNRFIYSLIISDGEKSIGINFDDKGNLIYKSALLPDEENEANMISLKLKQTRIYYKKYNICKNELLRCDIEKKKYLLKEFRKIKTNKEYDKLKYIYYEVFDELSNDNIYIYNKIINNLDNYIIDFYKVLNSIK